MQKIKQKLVKTYVKMRSFTPLQCLLATVMAVFLMLTVSLVTFLWPKTINYNFASEKTCFNNPIVLPNTFQVKNNQNYELTHANSIKIKNYPIFSKKSCVNIKKIDQAGNNIKLAPFGNKVFAQKINISLPETPQLSYAEKNDKPASTIGKIQLKLDQSDKTFSYNIIANQKSSNCQANDDSLVCDLSPLGLAQSQKYELEFVRKLNEQMIGTVYKTTIQTVDPILIINQSIKPGALIYDSPTSIIVTTNKDLVSYKNVELINLKTSVAVKTSTKVNGKNLEINFDEPLPRETVLKLGVGELTATDEAFLSTPLVTEFRTSGGPKVTSINFSSYGENPNKNFVLNFDSALALSQNLGSLVSLIGPSGPVPVSVSIDASSITISPNSTLPRCTAYTVKIKPGLNNRYGIASQAVWSTNTRTICQEILSIGTSVQGRSIAAYKFGNGPAKTIFVGTTHGDELSSKHTLDSWINDLEANFHKIPAGRTIYVIPNLNPDAFAAGTRTNANNVDLNRNFPANNWKPDVVMPGGNLVVGGGGSTALSEPESKAIANFILAQKPELVLTYHSKGSMVIANESGNSVAQSQSYGAKSGYWARKESDLGTTFAYDTTGAMENWLYDKVGIATLLIELSSHYGNEFSRNKNAMWDMIN